MKWHLDCDIPKYSLKIDYSNRIVLFGSCFAENLFDWLKERHFNVYANPNGILFNPKSIYQTVKQAIETPNIFNEDLIFEKDNVYKSWTHQGFLFDKSKSNLLKKIINTQQQAHQFIQQADIIIITFGSAYAYIHKALNTIVSNCHKFPANIFTKQLLSVSDIVADFNFIITRLTELNPKVKFIFSVSPVKYKAYGLINNNLSKATLLLSIHELCNSNTNCFYFPAYEIVTDELRDYRFFKEDLSHPNDIAIKYVMNKFKTSLIDESTIQIVERLEKIIQATHHKI